MIRVPTTTEGSVSVDQLRYDLAFTDRQCILSFKQSPLGIEHILKVGISIFVERQHTFERSFGRSNGDLEEMVSFPFLGEAHASILDFFKGA